jgi:hypothetical protein
MKRMARARRSPAVAETRAFSEDIDAMLSAEGRDTVIAAIARDPAGGDLVPGTGGLRKRRAGDHASSWRGVSGLRGVCLCLERA